MPRQAGAVSTTSGTAKPINKTKMGLSDCTLRIYESHSKSGTLDLLPSTLQLVEIQHSRRQTEIRLKTWIADKASHFDYVLIDCPPTISIFTEAAILTSNKYVVPIKPDPLSVVGLPLLERYIDDFIQDMGMKIEQVGIIFTQVRGPAPRVMKEIMQEIRANRAGSVFAQHLSQATHVAESVTAHQPILKYHRSSDKLKLQIIDITNEFVTRTGG
jgi:chromosome partitioning protein